jgi:ribosomal-protein-alanine N-acetyltransferase
MWHLRSLIQFPPRYPKPSLDTRLIGPRVMLRMGDVGDWRSWRNLRDLSRDFLTPWEPTWPDKAMTYGYFCGLLRRQWRDWRQGNAYAFQIFLHSRNVERGLDGGAPLPLAGGEGGGPGCLPPDPSPAKTKDLPSRGKSKFLQPLPQGERNYTTLIGGITLNDIQRGIAQKGTLGYWIGKPYAGHGYMTEAVQLICDFAFQTLRLHRVEASCLPHNERSKNLLTRLGFEQEGYAKSYLQIDGKWQDHILWGKVPPGKAPSQEGKSS